MSFVHLSVPSVVAFVALLAGLETNSLTREAQQASAAAPAIVEYQIPRAGNFPHDPAVA